MLKGPYRVSGIDLGLAMYKANSLPTILSLCCMKNNSYVVGSYVKCDSLSSETYTEKDDFGDCCF